MIYATLRRTATVLAYAVYCACGSDREATDSPGQAVRYARPGLEIGESSGVVLTRVGVVLEADDGTLLVALPRESRVLRIGPRGDTLASIGNRGDGPGEFRALGAIGWLNGQLFAMGTVAEQGRTVQLFSPDGFYQRTVHLPVAELGENRRAVAIAPLMGGGFVGVPQRVGGASDTAALPVVIADSNGTILGRVASNRAPKSVVYLESASQRRLVTLGAIGDSLEDNPLVLVGARGRSVVVLARAAPANGSTASYSVTRYDSAGREVAERSIEYLPRQLSPAVRGGMTAALQTAAQDFGGLDNVLQFAERQLGITGYRTPVARALLGEDSTIWIMESEQDSVTLVRWRVLSATLTDLPSVLLPRSLEPRLAFSDHVWCVGSDSLGAPILVRYDMDRVVR